MKNSRPEWMLPRPLRHIHCLGIGGMGVGPLAIYLAALGYVVSGEDDGMTEAMAAQLRKAGIRVGTMEAACELVVASSAIRPGHPTYVEAQARQLPIMRRGELLAELAKARRFVAVCGSHGKTTTTAMLATALRSSGFDCGYVLGGLFGDDSIAPAQAGSNDWLVAEVDESDGTIAAFSPEITVAVNLDWDHPDFYRQQADLEAAFAALFSRTRGQTLISKACPISVRLAPKALTFGDAGADYAGEIVATQGERLQLRLGGRFSPGQRWVRARGEFNARNATAALAAAQLMGATLAESALAEYPGVRRRQGVLLAEPGLLVLEDYAHHPGEIRALLESLRQRVQAGESQRLVVAFQPHRYSRTAQFKAEFAEALALADQVILLDGYAAGEAPLAGGMTQDLAQEFARGAAAKLIAYEPGEAAFMATLDRVVRWGDLVAVVGAGDIDQVARRWLVRRRWRTLAEALAPQLSGSAKLTLEEPLAARTTMRVGGAARLFVEPTKLADLRALVRTAHERHVPVLVLGRGSNVIVPDEGVDALVISLAHRNWAQFERRPEGTVWAGAGLRLKNLCGLAAKAGLAGFEFLEGIPGCIGGALHMNAGAMGQGIFDLVESVQYLTMDGQVVTRNRADLTVGYRYCRELTGTVILGATLRPRGVAGPEKIRQQIETYREQRRASQPRDPSAGCIFKNPPGEAAGRLIDQCGLKGVRVGEAEVSPVHANFIVNRGSAKADEVLELVRQVRTKVGETRGIWLEPEVQILGRAWKDFL